MIYETASLIYGLIVQIGLAGFFALLTCFGTGLTMVMRMLAAFFGTDSADFSTILNQVIDFLETTGKYLTGGQTY